MRKRGYFMLGGLVLCLGMAPALTQADGREAPLEAPGEPEFVPPPMVMPVGWGEGGPGRHHGGPGGFGGHGGPGMRMMGGPGMELHMIVRKLSLTQSQQEALDKITESHRSNFRSLFKQMHDLRKKVDAKFFSDTPPSASDADVVALESLRGKMASEGLASSLEVRAFLVKENLWPKAVEVWKKMQAMREQMRSFFEEKQ